MMIGDKFGKLTVTERASDAIRGIRHTPMWVCECSCGNRITASGKDLRQMKNCGNCKKANKDERSDTE